MLSYGTTKILLIADSVAVETGLFKSDVLSTLDNPTSDFNKVIYEDNFLLFIFVALSTFKSSNVCCAVETGLDKSEVLSTLANHTSDFVKTTDPLTE